MKIPMRPRARNILAFVFLLVTGSSALAQTARYELFPEPHVRQNATNRSASAYVVDKKNNQFWICTARYNFRDLMTIAGTASSCRSISEDLRSVNPIMPAP